jgi:flagellar hook-basal body complex protein FliE
MQLTASATAGISTPISTGNAAQFLSGFSKTSQPVGSQSSASPFADLLTDAVGQIGQLEEQARTTVDQMMSGSGVDVHQAMIATEKASMAFELALAVRNKAVQAYQSVIGMQF